MPDEDQTEYELERTRQVVAETIAAQVDPEPDEDEEAPEAEGWDAYTVAELQDELRERDLAVSGSKAELLARIHEDVEANA